MRPKFSYRTLHTRTSEKRRLLLATFLVVLIYLADVLSGGAIRGVVHTAAAVVSRSGSHVVSVIVGSGLFSTRYALQQKNELLSERIATLEERSAAYDVLKAENDELRAFLNITGTTTSSSEGVTAAVVSSPRSSPYGTFLIGAGSADGIVKGSLVLTSGRFVVGLISDTGEHTAVVNEVFAPGAEIEGLAGGAPITIRGVGGGNARAKVPRGLVVSVGDSVVAPSLGQHAIGIVGAVASSSASAAQDLYIRLPANLASLQYVYIVPLK